MDGKGFHFAENSRVRLRNTVDPAVYGDFACTGNEGWIADRREDRFGLPEVLIKWDKNHWAYNGVPDCWTFEEHFELVEDNMDKQEKVRAFAMQFADAMASLFDDEKKAKPEVKSEPDFVSDLTSRILNAGKIFQSPEEEDPFQEAVQAAAQKLSESDGFVVIGVERSGKEGPLEPFAFGFSKSPQSELAIQAHMAGVAARAHQELVLQTLRLADSE